jgi:hypothetical protein
MNASGQAKRQRYVGTYLAESFRASQPDDGGRAIGVCRHDMLPHLLDTEADMADQPAKPFKLDPDLIWV